MVMQCSLGGNADGHTVFSRGNVDGHTVFSRGNVDGHTVFSRGTLIVIQCSLGER
jgi:hypothetical protein